MMNILFKSVVMLAIMVTHSGCISYMLIESSKQSTKHEYTLKSYKSAFLTEDKLVLNGYMTIYREGRDKKCSITFNIDQSTGLPTAEPYTVRLKYQRKPRNGIKVPIVTPALPYDEFTRYCKQKNYKPFAKCVSGPTLFVVSGYSGYYGFVNYSRNEKLNGLFVIKNSDDSIDGFFINQPTYVRYTHYERLGLAVLPVTIALDILTSPIQLAGYGCLLIIASGLQDLS